MPTKWLELFRQLLEVDADARVLVFHARSRFGAAKALKIGAKGYVSKNASG